MTVRGGGRMVLRGGEGWCWGTGRGERSEIEGGGGEGGRQMWKIGCVGRMGVGSRGCLLYTSPSPRD